MLGQKNQLIDWSNRSATSLVVLGIALLMPAGLGAQNTPPPAERGPAVVDLAENGVAADDVPEGQELVNIDFPEPTDIRDIIRAVSLWTGKNVILGRDVNGKVQMISPRKVTKEEAYQAFLSALNLLGLTTVETGKVIKILPTRNAVKGNLKTFLGSNWTPMTDEMITQIVPLKYIDAKEIQRTLSRIVSSNSMIAYQPTNTLIISDSGYKVRRILDIIRLLDVQGQQPKLSIVPIKYADAKAIADKVGEIFKAATTGGKKSTSTSYRTYKIMVDERTNSVIIFGPPRTIADVKALVRRFDIRVTDPTRQAAIHVRPLDYADAKKLASTLSALASGSKTKSSLRRPPISSSKSKRSSVSSTPAVAQFADDLKITADESSNSLLITGSRAAYEAINSIIRKLDIRKSQVFVEADILDINVEGGFEFGTSIFAGAGNKDGSGTKYPVTWQAEKIGGVIQSQVAKSQSDQTTASAVGAFAKDFNIGILAGNKINIPGIGSISPGALIKMIKTDAASRELASPGILTANNEEALITVGDKLFYRNTGEANLTTGISQTKVEKEDVDLTLTIKPNISHTNYVTIKLDLDANTGTVNSANGLPSVSKRKLKQNVTVKNGQTVVISGLMKTSERESYSKIPLLGDIPILGWLFRNSTIAKKRNNLMVFLTPYIVHGADDLAAIYQKKMNERDEFFRIIYGSDFEEEDFYQLLPSRKDGIYQADAFDIIEKKSRDDRQAKLLKDMGYSNAEIEALKETEEQAANDTAKATKDPVEQDEVSSPESFIEGSDEGAEQPMQDAPEGQSGDGLDTEAPVFVPPTGGDDSFNDAPVNEPPVIDEPINDEPINDEPINDEPINDEPINDAPQDSGSYEGGDDE